jgi:hypothetical protein
MAAGSQDLTPKDVFLGFYVKNIVYQGKDADLRTSRHRITEATAKVIEVMLVNTKREIEYCFDVCRATNEAHIETYYVTKGTEFCPTEL